MKIKLETKEYKVSKAVPISVHARQLVDMDYEAFKKLQEDLKEATANFLIKKNPIDIIIDELNNPILIYDKDGNPKKDAQGRAQTKVLTAREQAQIYRILDKIEEAIQADSDNVVFELDDKDAEYLSGRVQEYCNHSRVPERVNVDLYNYFVDLEAELKKN